MNKKEIHSYINHTLRIDSMAFLSSKSSLAV